MRGHPRTFVLHGTGKRAAVPVKSTFRKIDNSRNREPAPLTPRCAASQPSAGSTPPSVSTRRIKSTASSFPAPSCDLTLSSSQGIAPCFGEGCFADTSPVTDEPSLSVHAGPLAWVPASLPVRIEEHGLRPVEGVGKSLRQMGFVFHLAGVNLHAVGAEFEQFPCFRRRRQWLLGPCMNRRARQASGRQESVLRSYLIPTGGLPVRKDSIIQRSPVQDLFHRG